MKQFINTGKSSYGIQEHFYIDEVVNEDFFLYLHNKFGSEIIDIMKLIFTDPGYIIIFPDKMSNLDERLNRNLSLFRRSCDISYKLFEESNITYINVETTKFEIIDQIESISKVTIGNSNCSRIFYILTPGLVNLKYSTITI